MLVPRTATHLATLCAALVPCTPPAWAQDLPIPHFQVMELVSDAALASIRARGHQCSGPPAHGDVAVILWDEPKTPRPSGNKNSVASVALQRIRPAPRAS